MSTAPAGMRDVAKRARVSITTVSHVINNTRPVAEKTRTRVLREIDRLNYYKNRSACLLVRGRSDLLGLIISDIANPFFPELIKSFEEACGRQGLDVLLCATSYDPEQAEKALRRMLENRVQAVAIMTSQFDARLIASLAERNVPLVRLGARPPHRNSSGISLDYRRGVASAVQHLLDLGHKRIGIAAGPQTQVSAVEYRLAMESAMDKAGLKPAAILEGDRGPESGAFTARNLLSAPDRPTAILCGNDRMAIGAIGAAGDLGLRVPDDVSIVGSHDVWMSRYCHPPLTTVRIPRDEIGKMAFNILIEMLNAKKPTPQTCVLETEFVLRRSTAAAPAQAARVRQKNSSTVGING